MLTGLRKDTHGAVMVEFALCLPVLLIMYVGCFVVTDMVSCNRKVTIATRALADMASHNLSPSGMQLDPANASASAYLSASAVTISPYDVANATQTIALLRVCDATHAYQVWSQSMSQTSTGAVVAAPITVGTPGPASVVAIPVTMVTSPSIPVNPNGSTGICSNYQASNSTQTQVGQAGGYIFMGFVRYNYIPLIGLGPTTSTPMADTIYMSPRLY
jgi:Flp pilus assembly protein TadG